LSDTLEAMRHRIGKVQELGDVVRTMKALAASNITQFERAARSSSDYSHLIELGLSVCLAAETTGPPASEIRNQSKAVGVVVFGSDQGLVGMFNESIASFVVDEIKSEKIKVWAVGQRAGSCLEDRGLQIAKTFSVPSSISAISALVGRIVEEIEAALSIDEIGQVSLVHNMPVPDAAYEPYRRRILPFDQEWRKAISELKWPTKIVPQRIDPDGMTLAALIREYLFVSLFRTCAESLAGENKSRVLTMQAAQKNIGDLLEDLNRSFHRMRQESIDEELFDVMFGFEALRKKLVS